MSSLSLTATSAHSSVTLDEFSAIAEKNCAHLDRRIILARNEQRFMVPQAPEPPDTGCCLFSCTPTPTDEDRAINRRTWKAFFRAFGKACNPNGELVDRYHRIIARYGLNYTKSLQMGEPLCVHHVQRVAVGMARIFREDLQAYCEENQNIRSLSSQQIRGLFEKLLEGVYAIRDTRTLDQIRGGLDADSFWDHFSYDPFRFDKRRILLSTDMDALIPVTGQGSRLQQAVPDIGVIELLNKVFASQEMEAGEIIQVPIAKAQNGTVTYDYYEVYRKIGAGTGLVAYALRPLSDASNLSPLIICRPTQTSPCSEDAPETVFDDMQEEIGSIGWNNENVKGQFRHLMLDPNFRRNKEKVRVAGYSLGSTHASYFVAMFFLHISQFFSINGPGVGAGTIDRFARAIQGAGQAVDLQIYIIRHQRDIVGHGGWGQLGYGLPEGSRVTTHVIEYRPYDNDQDGSLMKAHSQRIYGRHAQIYDQVIPQQEENVIRIQEFWYPNDQIQAQLCNSMRGEEIAWYERMRVFWGAVVLYHVLYVVWRVVSCILYCLGIELFRSSNQPENPTLAEGEVFPADDDAEGYPEPLESKRSGNNILIEAAH